MIRYRQLDQNGDMSWGANLANFYIDNGQAVAQAVLTRLRLWLGEWFLDTSQGVPYLTKVFGKNTQATADTVIRSIILGTLGVTSIASYQSVFNRQTRAITIQCSVYTQFTGQQAVPVTAVLTWPQVAVTDNGMVVITDTGQEVFATTPPQGSPVTVTPVPT